MPDLAFSAANNVTMAWTVQQLANNSAGQSLGYTVHAPETDQTEDEK